MMRFVSFVFLGYCGGILAIVADMSNDRLRIFSPESKVPEIMFMRLPGFAAQSVLLAFLICALLYLADRMGAVSSARALSISAMCCGFLSWSAFYLQMSFIAGEMEPPGVIPIFGVYGSVVPLFVLIAAVGRLTYASGVSGPVESSRTEDHGPNSVPLAGCWVPGQMPGDRIGERSGERARRGRPARSAG